jgi:hypothetical protein
MDHIALVYLIHKPQLFRWIAWWLLVFLEYNYLVIYKPRWIHLVVDIFSQLSTLLKTWEYQTKLWMQPFLLYNQSNYKRYMITYTVESSLHTSLQTKSNLSWFWKLNPLS